MNIKLDKMQYHPNLTSYYLGLASIILNIIYVFKVLSIMEPTVIVGIKILLNIVLLLITFLANEKIKYYSKYYALLMIIVGVLVLLRLLYVPIQVFNGTVVLKTNMNRVKIGFYLTTILILMSFCYCTSGIIGLNKHIRLERYKSSVDMKKVLDEYE